MSVGPSPKHALRIAAIYAALGALWILFSDHAALLLFPDPRTLAIANTVKGWGFIAVTATLLYVLVRRQLHATAEAAAGRAAAEVARSHAENQQALAREAATAAAHRLSVATRAAGLGTWELDLAAGRLECDAQMYALFHIAPGERANRIDDWEQCIHPDDRSGNHLLFRSAIEGRNDYHTQFRVLWPDGQCRHLESHALVLRDAQDRPVRVVGVNWDVTDRVVAERRLHLLTDHARDVLWAIDPVTLRYTYLSPAVERLTGFSAAELLHQPATQHLSERSLALIRDLLPIRLQAFLAGDPTAGAETNELEHFCRDGSIVWLEVVTAFVRTDTGGVELIGISRDVTRRRAAEEALRTSANHLRRAEEIAGIGHWSLQVDSGRIEASAGAARIYGLPPAENWPFSFVQSCALPEYRPELDRAMRALLAGEQPYDVVFRMRQPSTGAIVAIHSRAEYDPATRLVFGTLQDTSERERTLAALRTSEARLRVLVGNAPVVLFQIGADGVFRMSEGGGLGTLGLRPGEVVGRSAFEIYRDHPEICAQIRDALGGQPTQAHIKVGPTWFEIFYSPLVDSAGAVTDVVGLAIDITDRKQAEARLRLQSAALSAAAPAIAITDARGTIEWINPAFTALTGYSAMEAVGRNLGRLVQTGQQPPEFYSALWATILAGQTWHGELVNRHKDGSLIPEEQTITPVRNDDGTITHFVAIKQDITDRRRLQEQALRSQRLESVGRLAGGIAHDLNNILAPVLMAPSILREALTDPSCHEILDAVEISATRGAAIIRQLLTFSRGGTPGEREPVQLRLIVRDMTAIIRETFPKNILTRTDVHSDPWLVEADPTQLHQVLMNLCVNSRDAMPAGGTLTITLENVELDDAAVACHAGAGPGPHVLLGVFDTGHGIAPEHLDKVFDPFFTTKEVGKGTGLGLATVLGIVRGHRGFIDVRSQPGNGTQVRIYLPARAGEAASPQIPAGELPPRGRGELILVVDDEENVRRITRSILERHGYRVIVAADGAEALARFQQHRPAIRLVLTDLLMPFMDGATLIRAIHEVDSGARILAVSGHASPEDPLLVGTDVVGFLQKPYLRPALLSSVAQALAVSRN
ncbi:MAG TPA: PAS domain S-box protein [Opitutaceae bacterium]|nr:PAS domain S-box protein [Opitutaceae bacterium]